VSGTEIQKGNSTVMPDKYIFEIIPLGGTANAPLIEKEKIYYIIDGERLLTNTNIYGSGGTPTFKAVEEPTTAQEWKIAPDANGGNCYKITSNADGKYLNEYGVFGTNAYYSDWNTYLITAMGENYSMQWTQSAVKNGKQTFIVVSGDRLEAKEVSRSESYTVKIISKEDYDTSVKNINKNGISYNGREISSEDAESIAIYSIDGRIIKQDNACAISTAELASGVYIAIATYGNSKEILRFIVE
jgi:hypothetical protein